MASFTHPALAAEIQNLMMFRPDLFKAGGQEKVKAHVAVTVFIERLNDEHEARTIGSRIKGGMNVAIQAAAELVRHGALQPRGGQQSLVAGYVLVRHGAPPIGTKVNHGRHTKGNHGLTEDKNLLKNAPATSFHLWKRGARGCPCPLLQTRLVPERRLSAARAPCFSQPFYRCI